MATLQLLHYPDPRLRNVAAPVTDFDDTLAELVANMFETMDSAPGIGLAATQVNVHLRVLVVDASERHDSPVCLVNPTILTFDGTGEMEEGCLSVPGVFEAVTRAERITVQAHNEAGEPLELEFEGLWAVCVQHEIDHLDGKLFVDYLSRLKRSRIRKKLEKIQKQT